MEGHYLNSVFFSRGSKTLKKHKNILILFLLCPFLSSHSSSHTHTASLFPSASHFLFINCFCYTHWPSFHFVITNLLHMFSCHKFNINLQPFRVHCRGSLGPTVTVTHTEMSNFNVWISSMKQSMQNPQIHT